MSFQLLSKCPSLELGQSKYLYMWLTYTPGEGVGIFPIPVMTPGATVVCGVLIPTSGVVPADLQDGILQQEGSEGSGTREQDTGTLLNTAHL